MKPYDRSEERTGVQDVAHYMDHLDIQSDFVMVYGTHHLKERIASWREHGYIVHLMTGVSWGEYQDYLYGEFDGTDHQDEGQMSMRGPIVHGPDVPYMVPSLSFSHYLVSKLKVAVDCGVEAIHLEEPEFWTRGGYSPAFKREWKIYYGKDWEDPASSPDAAYRAGKLKQYLYTRMLDRLCSELKEYAMVKYNRLLRFYVPTHSLINYAQWGIVSPESALLDLPCIDGYIAQIWTGTARTANKYEGVHAERTFETAFLEYGVMQELIRGTNRRMWFLQDPVEDNPRFDWNDYRANYYRTVVAALMHPGVDRYEVAPWPSRVFGAEYPTGIGEEKSRIPDDYRTNLLSVMQTLRDMKQEKVHFAHDAEVVGVLIADSAMFERQMHKEMKPDRFYPDFDAFFGLSLPLLKKGLPVRPVQLDNIRRVPGYLSSYRVLVLSYEYMKPEHPDLHPALAQWVRDGGTLIYVGDGSDTFHRVVHWWNSGACDYDTPAAHLTEQLGLGRTPKAGITPVGKGQFCLLPCPPQDIACEKAQADTYRALVHEAMAGAGIPWEERADMILHRGPYVITAVMEDEGAKAVTLEGSYINLFDTALSRVENPCLKPGDVGLWYDVSSLPADVENEVIAAAARLEQVEIADKRFSFTAICPGNSRCVMRVADHRRVKDVISDTPITLTREDGGYLLSFQNSNAGVRIRVLFD